VFETRLDRKAPTLLGGTPIMATSKNDKPRNPQAADPTATGTKKKAATGDQPTDKSAGGTDTTQTTTTKLSPPVQPG
jgi:hypothetical protein